MSALLVILMLVVLMAIGLPIAWCFAAVLAALTFMLDVNPNTLMLQGFRSLNSVVLIALPLFILAGHLMEAGGIAKRIIAFILHFARGRGALGASIVIASAIFGAIAGTATAAVAAMGMIVSGPARENGYPPGYTAALLGVSSLLGILIPPSITLILFAVATQQSVAACFAATLGPAALLIVLLLVYNGFVVRKRFDIRPVTAKPDSSTLKITLDALPALTLPVIILGGIYGGIFTPTEAAAVAVLATFIIGGAVYREFTWSSLRHAVVKSCETTGSIILILLFSLMISKILASERIPQQISELLLSVSSTPVMTLLVVNAVLIVAGALMDDISVTVVISPMFMPAMVNSGVDPVQFAAIVACSVVIGANSPPVAPILYMSSRICKAPVGAAMRASIELLVLIALPVLLVTSFWPALSLTIPRLLGLM